MTNIPFTENYSVKSPDSTTLFCTSGMQQHKTKFQDLNYKNTFSNVQSCLRLNDLDEIGDGTHLLVFNMLGLFSFREKSIQETISLFLDFMSYINLNIDYVTIHSDMLDLWRKYYPSTMEIRIDNNNIWSDGNIGGYCTEFYHKDIEVGNIVNPLGTCIDVGFGSERLESLVYGVSPKTKLETLESTILTLYNSGFIIGNNKENYIVKKLVTEYLLNGGKPLNDNIVSFLNTLEKRVETFTKSYGKQRYKDKDDKWWIDTFGMSVNDLDKYKQILNSVS